MKWRSCTGHACFQKPEHTFFFFFPFIICNRGVTDDLQFFPTKSDNKRNQDRSHNWSDGVLKVTPSSSHTAAPFAASVLCLWMICCTFIWQTNTGAAQKGRLWGCVCVPKWGGEREREGALLSMLLKPNAKITLNNVCVLMFYTEAQWYPKCIRSYYSKFPPMVCVSGNTTPHSSLDIAPGGVWLLTQIKQ